MASLEQQSHGGNYRIVFWFGGRKFSRTLKTNDDHEANSAIQRVEENIRLVERGRLEIPNTADVATFLLSDGRIDKKPSFQATMRLADLVVKYRQEIPRDSLEANTLCTIEIHLRHLQRILPAKLPIDSISQTHLQQYVEQRSREPGRRGNSVSAVTIKKELATLRAIWNWGRRTGDVHAILPIHGLKYPKTTEKPAFQTFAEIDSQIARGGLSESEQAELWDSLFLTVPELTEVLAFVKKSSEHAYLYPMLMFAAQTGARRSEMLRARVTDINLETNSVVLREKKRVRGQRTTRRVPLSKLNIATLEEWLKCQAWHRSGWPTQSQQICGVPPGEVRRNIAQSNFRKLKSWRSSSINGHEKSSPGESRRALMVSHHSGFCGNGRGILQTTLRGILPSRSSASR